MKKKVFLIIVALLGFAALLHPTKTRASCYYIGNTGYAECAGGLNSRRCSNNNLYYACCNEKTDVCPAPITTAVGPDETPTPPNPNSNPDCGGTSQICCSGSSCDTADLHCTLTGAGYRCLGQAQINLLPGGSTKATSGNGKVATISDLGTMIQTVIGYVLGFAGIVFFVLLVVGGFKYITSGGDPKAVEGAQKTLTSAIAGLVVILLSYLILVIIKNITGVDVTTFNVILPK